MPKSHRAGIFPLLFVLLFINPFLLLAPFPFFLQVFDQIWQCGKSMNPVKLMSGPWGHHIQVFSPVLVCLHCCPALAWCSLGLCCWRARGCAGGLPITWELCISSAPLVCPCAQAPSSSAKQPAAATCHCLVEVQPGSASSYLCFVQRALSLAVCCSTFRSWNIVLPVPLNSGLTGESRILSREWLCPVNKLCQPCHAFKLTKMSLQWWTSLQFLFPAFPCSLFLSVKFVHAMAHSLLNVLLLHLLRQFIFLFIYIEVLMYQKYILIALQLLNYLCA